MNAGDPLAGLHDIVEPEPVSYLLQTVGWAVLLLVVIALAVWVGVGIHRRWLRRRYRELALAELEALDRRLVEGDRDSVFAALPELVKRTALVAYPRSEVASLAGDEWLEFLDRGVGGRAFTAGPGRLLTDLAYRADAGAPGPSLEEWEALLAVVRSWIRDHSSPEVGAAAARGGG